MIITLTFLGGVALGALYYGGLWWTVKRIATGPRPWLVSGLSLPLRLAAALLGFYLLAAGEWRRLLAAMLGFISVGLFMALRLVLKRRDNTETAGEKN